MGEFFIDDILQKYKNSHVTLHFNDADGFSYPEGSIVEGYLVDDTISMESQSNWNDLGEEIQQLLDQGKNFIEDVLKKIPLVGGAASSALNLGVQTAGIAMRAAGVHPTPVVGTITAWQGTEKPQFDLGLLFVQTKDGEDIPEKSARGLSARCYPDFVDYGVMMQRGPMGYKPMTTMAGKKYEPGAQDSMAGTCTLTIGKWLKAPGLVLQNASFEYSKECSPSGSPLYAQGKVTLIPYRMITYKEYLNYYTQTSLSQPDITKLARSGKEELGKLMKEAGQIISDIF